MATTWEDKDRAQTTFHDVRCFMHDPLTLILH